MSAKSLLKQVRKEMFELKIKKDELEQIKMGLLPKAITYKADRVQQSIQTDRVGDTLAKTDSLEEIIANSIEELKSRYSKAYLMVESLSDTTQRQVLHLYFLSNDVYTMEQIAEMLGYSVRQVYRIYDEALGELDGACNDA